MANLTPEEKQKSFKINMTFPTSEMLGSFILGKLETTEAWVVPIYPDTPDIEATLQAYKESLSFTNEKLDQSIIDFLREFIERDTMEYEEAVEKLKSIFSSSILSTIEQAKKEGADAERKTICKAMVDAGNVETVQEFYDILMAFVPDKPALQEK